MDKGKYRSSIDLKTWGLEIKIKFENFTFWNVRFLAQSEGGTEVW